jgi:hypothetical protein
MEQNKNIDAFQHGFGLTGKEAVLLAALLAGTADPAALRAAGQVTTHEALRQHISRLRRKLPRGGVTSSRLPTRYWLSPGAVECCLEASRLASAEGARP